LGWENRYPLPWDRLDLPKIEAAMKHVSASLSPRRTKLVVHDPDHVSCFFEVSPADEHRWDILGDLEARFAEEQIAESDRGWVEVEFWHYPPDEKSEFKGCTEFKFRSGRSGNGIFSGCAMEITERFGKFFGVRCEPL
jgi:hypothetical protein